MLLYFIFYLSLAQHLDLEAKSRVGHDAPCGKSSIAVPVSVEKWFRGWKTERFVGYY